MADDPGKNTADVPRPDTADTAHTAGGGDPSGNPDAPRGAPVPGPWYRRPLFWGIVLFLLVLALLGWLFWKQWQAAEAEKQAQEAALNAQLAQNAEMDAYLAQLRALLKEEPCWRSCRPLLTPSPALCPAAAPASPCRSRPMWRPKARRSRRKRPLPVPAAWPGCWNRALSSCWPGSRRACPWDPASSSPAAMC